MREIDYLLVGKKIKRLRNEAGYTQEELAEKCGFSTSFLGHIERGTKKLSLETAVKIADCLRVSIDYLIIDGFSNDKDFLPSIDAILQRQDARSREKLIGILQVLGENTDKF